MLTNITIGTLKDCLHPTMKVEVDIQLDDYHIHEKYSSINDVPQFFHRFSLKEPVKYLDSQRGMLIVLDGTLPEKQTLRIPGFLTDGRAANKNSTIPAFGSKDSTLTQVN